MPGEVIAIFGGRSEIGIQVAGRLAAGSRVALAIRPGADAGQVSAHLTDSGAAEVQLVRFDADETSAHQQVVAEIEDRLGPIDIAVLAFGILGDQTRAETDEREVVRILQTDFVAQASLLTVLADRMRSRESGSLVVFSSVAGVRVRRANYVYGAAKAGLDGFSHGLEDSLHGSGVKLIIARPGFVIGRMTAGMKPAIFASTPDQVADAVVRRLRRGVGGVLWIPWPLRLLFAVAVHVPRSIWRKAPR